MKPAATHELRTTNAELVYGFSVGDYDKTKELVIDPLLASTYLGGGDGDYYGWDYTSSIIAIDSLGNVYVTGNTRSCDYPTTPGAYDTTHSPP
ncbi:MAG: SBBP repeat-containing protein [Deltaproteobacteria bacterium]|nr:SBBP repeat-containing protein [Deltaproteobacteria bacterium]